MTDTEWEIELSQWDEHFAPRGSVPRESVIYNGRYTLKLPGGGHRTFKIHTKDGKGQLAGKRIISLLTRADNDDEDSYIGFGFVDDRGIRVWKRMSSWYHEYADLVWRLAIGENIYGYELLVERRCLICNRALTTPESIERGIGPHCVKRIDR